MDNENKQISTDIQKNIKLFEDMFGKSADYYAKQIEICGQKAAVFLFDGVAGTATLWQVLLDAINRKTMFDSKSSWSGQEIFNQIFYHSDLAAESDTVTNIETFCMRLTSGHAVLFIDGVAEGIAFSVQMLRFRSVSEPLGEGNLRGSREGFTELVRINLSLLRRLHRGENLALEIATAPIDTGVEYALCYDASKVDKTMLETLKQKLKNAKPSVLVDSSYFVPWLMPKRLRFFTPVSYTQRPSVAVAKIHEGKVVLLVNGSPSAMVLPSLFSENFECLDDYAGTAYFASFMRLLKYFSFLLTVLLPALFVLVATNLPQLLPAVFLNKIKAADIATPLPLFAEMLLVILLLEIIREAGLRMPQSLGHSVSLVAALIIGDSAISAGIMSTPVILVAATTSIALFVTPSLYEPATILRILFLLAVGIAGPIGFIFIFFALLLSLSDLSLFGVPYFMPEGKNLWRDSIIRQNYQELSKLDFNINEAKGEE